MSGAPSAEDSISAASRKRGRGFESDRDSGTAGNVQPGSNAAGNASDSAGFASRTEHKQPSRKKAKREQSPPSAPAPAPAPVAVALPAVVRAVEAVVPVEHELFEAELALAKEQHKCELARVLLLAGGSE